MDAEPEIIIIRNVWNEIPMFFKHGLIFALLTYAHSYIVANVFGTFVRNSGVLVSMLGAGMLLIILLIGVGMINEFIAQRIWSVPAGSGASRFFIHGLVIFTLITIANYPFSALMASLISYSLTETIFLAGVILFVFATLEGIIGVHMARFFVGFGEARDTAVAGLIRRKCICGRSSTFRPIDIRNNGTVICPSCHSSLYIGIEYSAPSTILLSRLVLDPEVTT